MPDLCSDPATSGLLSLPEPPLESARIHLELHSPFQSYHFKLSLQSLPFPNLDIPSASHPLLATVQSVWFLASLGLICCPSSMPKPWLFA